jgi:hypothetical protein
MYPVHGQEVFLGPTIADNPSYRAIFCELPHCPCYTAIIIVAYLAGVRTLRERTAFTGTFNVTQQ